MMIMVGYPFFIQATVLVSAFTTYSGWVPMIAQTILQPKEWIIAKFLFARLVCVH